MAIASAITAGYLTPVMLDNFALFTVLGCAFVIGASAQQALALAIARFDRKGGIGHD